MGGWREEPITLDFYHQSACAASVDKAPLQQQRRVTPGSLDLTNSIYNLITQLSDPLKSKAAIDLIAGYVR